jgi:hypothetical protein
VREQCGCCEGVGGKMYIGSFAQRKNLRKVGDIAIVIKKQDMALASSRKK